MECNGNFNNIQKSINNKIKDIFPQEISFSIIHSPMGITTNYSVSENVHVERPYLDNEEETDFEKTVIPLSTEELIPSTDPKSEILFILNTIQISNWHQQYQAIESFRRIIVHHPTFVNDTLMHAVLNYIISACDNLRSAMAKNALLCTTELLDFVNNIICQEIYLTPFIDVLLRRASCEKKFLRDTAEISLEKLGSSITSFCLIDILVTYSSHRHPKICCFAIKIIESSLFQRQTYPEKYYDITKDRFGIIINALKGFRNAKDVDARQATKNSLKILREIMGEDVYKNYLQLFIHNQRIQNEIYIESFTNNDDSIHKNETDSLSFDKDHKNMDASPFEITKSGRKISLKEAIRQGRKKSFKLDEISTLIIK